MAQELLKTHVARSTGCANALLHALPRANMLSGAVRDGYTEAARLVTRLDEQEDTTLLNAVGAIYSLLTDIGNEESELEKKEGVEFGEREYAVSHFAFELQKALRATYSVGDRLGLPGNGLGALEAERQLVAREVAAPVIGPQLQEIERAAVALHAGIALAAKTSPQIASNNKFALLQIDVNIDVSKALAGRDLIDVLGVERVLRGTWTVAQKVARYLADASGDAVVDARIAAARLVGALASGVRGLARLGGRDASVPEPIPERAPRGLESEGVQAVRLKAEREGRKLILAGRSVPVEVARLVENLDLSRAKIQGLSGLLHFEGLRKLLLAESKVVDLGGLANARMLEVLDLHRCKAADYSVIGSLVHLKDLDLADSSVSEVRWISSLRALAQLYLGGTKVSDLTGVGTLTQLKTLELGGSEVERIEDLGSLTDLETLDLADCKIHDIGPLNGCRSLKELNLERTLVFDLSPLSSLTELKSVNVTGLNVRSYTPVKHVRRLIGKRGR